MEKGLECLEVIISEIGVEAGVDRGHRRNLVPPRPGHRAVTDDVGTGDMDDIGVELGEVATNARSEPDGQAVFGAAGDGDRRHVNQVAGRREGRLLNCRRIDPHLDPLAQQISDEPIERLVGPVADIIVIARKEGDAEVVRFHWPGL